MAGEDVLRRALAMQSGRILRFYLDELKALGGELSLDGRLVEVSEELRSLAERSADEAAYRRSEPYRRAITGISARLAATAASLHPSQSIEPDGQVEPYASPQSLLADLDILHGSLVANGSATIARGRLRRLRRAGQLARAGLAVPR